MLMDPEQELLWREREMTFTDRDREEEDKDNQERDVVSMPKRHRFDAKTTSFRMTWLSSSMIPKRRRLVFCYVGLFLPCIKTVRFGTRFGLSKTRESTKMQVVIFK